MTLYDIDECYLIQGKFGGDTKSMEVLGFELKRGFRKFIDEYGDDPEEVTIKKVAMKHLTIE